MILREDYLLTLNCNILDLSENSVQSKNSINNNGETIKTSKSNNLLQMEQMGVFSIMSKEEAASNSSFVILSPDRAFKSSSDVNNRKIDQEETSVAVIQNQISLDLRLNNQMGQIAEMKLISRSTEHDLYLANCMKGPILSTGDSMQFSDNPSTDIASHGPDGTAVMLSKSFDRIFEENNTEDDLKYLLKIWLQLNVLLPFSNWKQTHSGLVMSKDAISTLIKSICRKQSVTVSLWHLLFKCLIIVYETYNDTPDGLLLPLLTNFFSAVNSVDKSEHKIGQSVVITVNQFLEALTGRDSDLICSEVKYKRILIKVLVNLTNPG